MYVMCNVYFLFSSIFHTQWGNKFKKKTKCINSILNEKTNVIKTSHAFGIHLTLQDSQNSFDGYINKYKYKIYQFTFVFVFYRGKRVQRTEKSPQPFSLWNIFSSSHSLESGKCREHTTMMMTGE